MDATGEAPDKKAANVRWFRSQLAELIKNPLMQGKFLVIHDEQVVAAFDTFDAALRDAVAQYPVDEFVIQQVIPDNDVINLIRVVL